MEYNFASEWARLEALKVDLLAKVDAVPEGMLGKAPAPDIWSPLQLVSHLAKAEGVINGYIQKFDPTTASKPKPFLVGLLCTTLRSAITLPPPENMEPDSSAPLAKSVADWAHERSVLHDALASRDPRALCAIHPRVGTLTVRQVLMLHESHLIYHLKRFGRISRA